MPSRLILIVEDDAETIQSWQRDITEFNSTPKREVTFEAEFARHRADAIRMLDRVRFDCAVIDLRLPADSNPPAAQADAVAGNEVIEQILIQAGIPAVVYSGHVQEASERVRASQIAIMSKRGGGAMDALHWLARHESLMSAMDLTKRRIAKEYSQLFSQAIWPRWQDTWHVQNPEVLAGVITRQMVSHVAERLGMPPNSHHPEEFYVIPPLSDGRLATGDLVRIDNEAFVVVTPRCNMARDAYPNHLMLALCKPMDGIWKSLRDRFMGGDAKKQEKAADELRLYAVQGHSTSTHFLPPCGNQGPWLVDFREIRTVRSAEAEALLGSRFASIAAQFVPNLVQRCSAYLGRIGQPELDCDMLRGQMR